MSKTFSTAFIALITGLTAQACSTTQAENSDEQVAQASTAVSYPTTEIPCPAPAILLDEVKGETYDCGILTVPENYDEPNGRQIELS